MLINQLKPFSPERFDACMNHLMRVYGRSLDQHDITKLHVMADFFHVLETGKQMIGGRLSPWKHGPVVTEGYNRIKSLGHRFDEAGDTHQGKIRVIAKSGNRFIYEPYGTVDDEDFSAAELESLRRAWHEIIPMTFGQRENFFHGDGYMGRAWNAARQRDGAKAIDWTEVIDAYDAQTGEDHTAARLMIEAWRGDG
jgi:hypothetical protein